MTVGADLDRLCDVLVDLVERPAWHHRALCRNTPPNWWFPMESAKPDDPLVVRAAAICAGCPVRQPCGEVGRRQSDGVWAGELRGRYHRRRAAAS